MNHVIAVGVLILAAFAWVLLLVSGNRALDARHARKMNASIPYALHETGLPWRWYRVSRDGRYTYNTYCAGDNHYASQRPGGWLVEIHHEGNRARAFRLTPREALNVANRMLEAAMEEPPEVE